MYFKIPAYTFFTPFEMVCLFTAAILLKADYLVTCCVMPVEVFSLTWNVHSRYFYLPLENKKAFYNLPCIPQSPESKD